MNYLPPALLFGFLLRRASLLQAKRKAETSKLDQLINELKNKYDKIWSSLSDKEGQSIRWPLAYRYLVRRNIQPEMSASSFNFTLEQKNHILRLLLILLRGHVLNGLTVRTSTINNAGNGLFTTKSFKRGSLLCIYSGTPVSLTQAMKRQKEGVHGDYVMGGFGLFWRVDAGPHPEVMARYINDHYEQIEKNNAKFIKLKKYKIALVVAKRDLVANEEIFASYGDGYWRSRK